MASGDTLITNAAEANMQPPASAYATLDTRVGTKVPVNVLDFDDTTPETMIFKLAMPLNYAGGGITVTLRWMATSATSGGVSWNVSIMSITDDADDVDTKDFAAANNAAEACASATGETKDTDITFTDGADSDSVAAGEEFFLKVTRDATGATATDDMAGDAELVSITIKET